MNTPITKDSTNFHKRFVKVDKIDKAFGISDLVCRELQRLLEDDPLNALLTRRSGQRARVGPVLSGVACTRNTPQTVSGGKPRPRPREDAKRGKQKKQDNRRR